MKYMKGIMIGTLISAGMMMMYAESSNSNKKKMMRKGKQIVKKMGIV